MMSTGTHQSSSRVLAGGGGSSSTARFATHDDHTSGGFAIATTESKINCSRTNVEAIIVVVYIFFNARKAIAGAIIRPLFNFSYNSKNFNCIGALFSF